MSFNETWKSAMQSGNGDCSLSKFCFTAETNMFQQVEFFYEGLMSVFLVFVAHFTTWQVFADKMVSSIQMMFNFINLSATNRNTRKLLVRQQAASCNNLPTSWGIHIFLKWLVVTSVCAYLCAETAKTIHAIKSLITKVLSITFLWKG